jgi:hypothetical protein
MPLNETEKEQLAAAIASHLKTRGPWRVTRVSPNPYLVSDQGPGLWLSFGGYSQKGRISVHVLWPENHKGQRPFPYFNPGESAPSITVADTKSAEAIAKDIERRFLPEMLPLWDKQSEHLVNESHAAHTREANMYRLAEAIGGSVWRDEHEPTRMGIRIPQLPGKPYIFNLQVSDTSVDLDLRSVSVDDAIYIIRKLQS